jgi:hypothetical protein
MRARAFAYRLRLLGPAALAIGARVWDNGATNQTGRHRWNGPPPEPTEVTRGPQ